MADYRENRNSEAGTGSGLVRLRTVAPMTRRRLGLSLAAAGIGITVGYPIGPAAAATSINYMGWQGYDDATNVNGFLDKNGIVLQPTYMESQEQWIAAIRGGGRGN